MSSEHRGLTVTFQPLERALNVKGLVEHRPSGSVRARIGCIVHFTIEPPLRDYQPDFTQRSADAIVMANKEPRGADGFDLSHSTPAATFGSVEADPSIASNALQQAHFKRYVQLVLNEALNPVGNCPVAYVFLEPFAAE